MGSQVSHNLFRVRERFASAKTHRDLSVVARKTKKRKLRKEGRDATEASKPLLLLLLLLLLSTPSFVNRTRAIIIAQRGERGEEKEQL